MCDGWESSTSPAISPTSASGVVGQHNKIGVITFGATRVIVLCLCRMAKISCIAVYLLFGMYIYVMMLMLQDWIWDEKEI